VDGTVLRRWAVREADAGLAQASALCPAIGLFGDPRPLRIDQVVAAAVAAAVPGGSDLVHHQRVLDVRGDRTDGKQKKGRMRLKASNSTAVLHGNDV